jgi:hypothetical protein
MTNVLGVLRATSIVALLGAAGGALGGVVVAAGLIATSLVRRWLGADIVVADTIFLTAISAGFGAAYGVVLGPALGWLFMRSVPLWRAIGETAFAAALGVGVALAIPGWGLAVLVYPMIGATLAAVRLRLMSDRAAPRALPTGDFSND